MTIGDISYTLLEIVNEVQRKLDLSQTALTANKLAVQLVDFVNDTCSDLSDFGNWQEVLVSSNVTCVSGQVNYSINTSANIKNIGDIYFSQRIGPMRNITIQDMRIMTRVTAYGQPTQFTVFGVDSNGNPNIRVRPTPRQNEDGGLFSIVYYIRPPKYTTSDASVRVPFPGDLVVLGTLARYLLNESGGSPTDRYTATYQDYVQSRKESLNRYNGDTGWSIDLTPSLQGRRR